MIGAVFQDSHQVARPLSRRLLLGLSFVCLGSLIGASHGLAFAVGATVTHFGWISVESLFSLLTNLCSLPGLISAMLGGAMGGVLSLALVLVRAMRPRQLVLCGCVALPSTVFAGVVCMSPHGGIIVGLLIAVAGFLAIYGVLCCARRPMLR